jgi:hypothetical protein
VEEVEKNRKCSYNIVENKPVGKLMHEEREAGHIEEVANRFYTGNRVFDEIVGLSHGMTVLVLDETMHEGRLFLLSLLKDHSVAEVVSTRQSPGDRRKLYIELDNPQDVSIQLSRLRKKPEQEGPHPHIPAGARRPPRGGNSPKTSRQHNIRHKENRKHRVLPTPQRNLRQL